MHRQTIFTDEVIMEVSDSKVIDSINSDGGIQRFND